jgi:hypothetical protein
MRERAAQKLNPKMGRMGAEDPSRAFPAGPLEAPRADHPVERLLASLEFEASLARLG